MRQRTTFAATLGMFVALALVTTPAVGATGSRATLKPDLVVTAGELEWIIDDVAQRYFFRDHNYDLTSKARTRNAPPPPGAVAVATKASETGIFIKRGVNWVRQAVFSVPRLLPGRSNLGVVTFERTFPASAWKFGTYRVKACADIGHVIVERNEGNNCRMLTNNDLYVIPETFDGNVSGTFITESWQGSVHMELVDDELAGIGIFGYNVDDASTMAFVDSGTYQDCVFSGSGQTQHLHGSNVQTLLLSFDADGHGTYGLFDKVPLNFDYPVTVTCPDDDEPQLLFGPLIQLFCDGEWIDMEQTRNFPDPGLTQLSGDFTGLCFPEIHHSWHLLPDDTT
jgi:hypothetical protein